MTFSELFDERFQQILDRHQNERTVLFFRGFGGAQNRAVLSCPDRLAPARSVFGVDGTLNLSGIDSGKTELAERLSRPGQKILTGIYEQLIAVSGAVPDVGKLSGGRVVVVENNLFRRFFPSCIPPAAARRLYDFYRGDEEEPPEDIALLRSYYGDVLPLDDERWLVSFVDRHTEEGFEMEPFFPAAEPVVSGQRLPGGVSLRVSDRGFSAHKEDMMAGAAPERVNYLTGPQGTERNAQLSVLCGILDRMGVPYGVARDVSPLPSGGAAAGDRFLPLLRAHWGENASFRKLKTYKDPERSNETEEISQGEIIARVAEQSERALSGSSDFRNLFVTAPTGAGKSLLFQLPALHLAERFGAVTIVVTPLIALMKDQVTQLEQEHGVQCATFLNSSVTFEEREKRIARIRSGEKSILYLAPELLLSAPPDCIIGDRKVGLIVIDEAHTVTSWGRDFRSDYWMLGDFLTGLRRNRMRFPIFCLTATAVYGGTEDVVNETIETLSLDRPILYLGSVRRDNIRFDIRQIGSGQVTGKVEQFKLSRTAEAIRGFVENGEKTLVYCPFTTQVDEIYSALDAAVRSRVVRYHGAMDRRSREEAQNRFRSGESTVMVCTKAFGMGVDIRDIRNVYHYAPTGSLADYVQEIGRAAREKDLSGRAVEEFLPGDLRYVRTLYGLSEMRQDQLREILCKLCGLSGEGKRRSLLISPDTFSFLFDDRQLENKVKNGLLLLSGDLTRKYGFPVLQVRPGSVFAKGYVNVPHAAEQEFRRRCGRYVRPLEDPARRAVPSRGGRWTSDTVVRNSGVIYEADLPGLWENRFQDMTFLQFRHLFFDGELFPRCKGEKLSPRILVLVNYRYGFEKTAAKLKEGIAVLSGVFRDYKKAGKAFPAEEFQCDLSAALGGADSRFASSDILLHLFVMDAAQNGAFRSNADRLKFLSSRRAPSGEGVVYHVANSNYITLEHYFTQLLCQSVPDGDDVYRAFIPLGRSRKRPAKFQLLALLEWFGLASYEAHGGENGELFVRVNDPARLCRLSLGGYANQMLTEITRRHRAAQDLMTRFLQTDLDSGRRWDVIEAYFLGHQEEVERLLAP